MLTKGADDLLSTDIPENVYQGLKASPVTDVHVFGRRGPAQIKFTPIELRELGEVKDVDIVVYEEDFPEGWFNEDAEGVTNQHRVMARVINEWRTRELTGASRRLHLHFFSSPQEILGDENGKVKGIRFERTQLNSDGVSVCGTGKAVEFPVQAVYRAIGYFGSQLPQIPFDAKHGVISNEGGRVIDDSGSPITGVFATGWIKRGPVGLIGHTKSDAMETIDNLVADVEKFADPESPESDSILETLKAAGVRYTTWTGWLKLNQHELGLGAADTSVVERERVKVVDREEQIRLAGA
jgi:ferredoxin--NADP+ reductase